MLTYFWMIGTISLGLLNSAYGKTPDDWCLKNAITGALRPPPCNGAPGRCTLNSRGLEGGFVAATAKIETTLSDSGVRVNVPYLSTYAQVCDFASVRGKSRVYGSAWIGGHAQISDQAHVRDHAVVSDYAEISGEALIADRARVSGFAQVYQNACIYEDAHISGNAQILGSVWIYGKTYVSGNIRLNENPPITRTDSQANFEFGKVRVFKTDTPYSSSDSDSDSDSD